MRQRFIFLTLLFLLGLSSAGLAQPGGREAILDGWSATLSQAEAALRRSDLNDADLDSLQGRVQSVATSALAFQDEIKPDIDDLEDLLASITLPEGTGAEEPSDLSETRAKLVADLDSLTGFARRTELVILRSNQLLSHIAERRSERFTTALFARDGSALSPGLLADLVLESSRVLAGTSRVVADWLQLVAGSSDSVTILLALLAVLIVVVVLTARRAFLRWAEGPTSLEDPGRPQKVLAAFAIVIVDVGVPLLILLGLRALLAELGLLPRSVDEIAIGLTTAVAIFTVITGLSRALAAPNRPAWRIAGIADSTARRVYGVVAAAAAILALYAFVVRLAGITTAPSAFVVGLGGVLSIPTAALALVATRMLVRGREALSEDERRRSAPWRVLTPLASIAAVVTIASAVVGYLAFASFMIEQIAFVWVVIGGFVLIGGLADVILTATLSPDQPVGRHIALNLGLGNRVVDQLRVVITGITRLMLMFVAALLIAAPWGFDSSTVTSRLHGLYYGVQVGSIRITFSTIIAAALVFVVVIALSRLFQRWLERRFLPTTGIDQGLKNSIRTGAGYTGVLLAVILAAIYAGIDFANIAIVAGALSVGIGFGLQGIVNNFVSGLILLAERPIRTGDWIEVGTDRGTVRRISVRATEIETFERASVIVPNSNLISGVVTNRYLRGNIGRIEIAVGVSYSSDPERVREVLLAAAAKHDRVASDPAPFVLFMDFGASSLDFELRCYVSDISTGLSVRSDLRFAILAALREDGIEIPFPQRDINVRDLPNVAQAFGTRDDSPGSIDKDRERSE
ncbi:MAG: mechanosensitive ion channel family protein [Hyphomicrobiales bacterium]|nr:mechanosensitive ion channel family protein [Hyphomicrobiales bacterium]